MAAYCEAEWGLSGDVYCIRLEFLDHAGYACAGRDGESDLGIARAWKRAKTLVGDESDLVPERAELAHGVGDSRDDAVDLWQPRIGGD
jgi:hypothetical protein